MFAGRLIRGVEERPVAGLDAETPQGDRHQPKNMLVDVTNYISIDRCRPLHVYDAKKLKGGIVARFGNGEMTRFVALDGKTYSNLAEMCVIADDSGAIGLGGVMGGESTGCSIDTVDVFIESAWFDPNRTARTGRATGILSDARFRIERGVDPQSCVDGIELATKLILETCGGEPSEVVLAGKVPEGPAPGGVPAARHEAPHRPRHARQAHGADPPRARLRTRRAAQGAARRTTVWADQGPVLASGRRRLRRHRRGADPHRGLRQAAGRAACLRRKARPRRRGDAAAEPRARTARRVLAGRGFLETVTWSFMFHEKAALMIGGANNLQTALTDRQPDRLGPRLHAPVHAGEPRRGCAAQRRPWRGGCAPLRSRPGLSGRQAEPTSAMMVAAVMKAAKARDWQGSPAPYNAFSAKADLFAILAALDQSPDKFQVGAPEGAHWHPGRAGTLRLGPKQVVASFGELHPAFLKALRVEGPVLAIELALDALPAAKAKPTKTRAVLDKADQTPVRRDFAFVVEEKVPSADITRMAMKADPTLITAARVFDVYRGASIGEGKKSVAIEITLQPRGAAMTDEQIEAASQSIVKSVAKATGATLRG